MITALNDLGIHPIIISSILYLLLGILPLFMVKETLIVSKEKDNLLVPEKTVSL
jgi:preprotein translocase subunit SecY